MQVQRRRRMRATRWLLLLVVVSLLPVPWMQGGLRHGASRDLALTIDGVAIDTPGMRYLTVLGYYPVLQALADQLVRDPGARTVDLLALDPPDWLRPRVNEPVAAALGRRAAGIPEPLRLRMVGETPDGRSVVVDRFNGRPIRTAEDLLKARELQPEEGPWFSTRNGDRYDGAPSVTLRRVQLRWETRLDAYTTGGVPFGHVAALREPVRDMPVGASHTLMVAIAAYEHASGRPLATGWTIAGTGALDPLTGAVTRVGGLPLKAKAAHQDGVRLLLYPAAQRGELDEVRTPGMRRVPVRTLQEAIDILEAAGRR